MIYNNQDIPDHLAFIEIIGKVFLEKSRAPHPDALQKFRPRGITWPLMRSVQARAARLKRQENWVDGLKMVWLEGGNPDGQPLLLLHGFGASKENWLSLVPFLSRHHRLYVLDLPGWGESQFDPSRRYGMDHQAQRVIHWMDKVIGQPAHVVGSSMGGGIAGLVAARATDQVASVTLMNAAGVVGERLSPFASDLIQGRNSLVTRRFMDVVRLFTLTTRKNRFLLASALAPVMFEEMVRRRHVNRFLFRELLSHQPDVTLPSFSEMTVPALILWGEQDQVLDVSCVDSFKRLIPHAETVIFPDVGHLPMIEVPLRTARTLSRFWQGHLQSQQAA